MTLKSLTPISAIKKPEHPSLHPLFGSRRIKAVVNGIVPSCSISGFYDNGIFIPHSEHSTWQLGIENLPNVITQQTGENEVTLINVTEAQSRIEEYKDMFLAQGWAIPTFTEIISGHEVSTNLKDPRWHFGMGILSGFPPNDCLKFALNLRAYDQVYKKREHGSFRDKSLLNVLDSDEYIENITQLEDELSKFKENKHTLKQAFQQEFPQLTTNEIDFLIKGRTILLPGNVGFFGDITDPELKKFIENYLSKINNL